MQTDQTYPDSKQNPLDEVPLKLHGVLQSLIGAYRKLMDVVRAEKAALVNADLRSIQELTYHKEAILFDIQRIENERLSLVSRSEVLWGIDSGMLTVTDVIHRVQVRRPQVADQLRSSLNALVVLMQRVSEQNRENQELVQKSIEHVESMKANLLGATSPQGGTYNAHGQRSGASGGRRLIAKQG